MKAERRRRDGRKRGGKANQRREKLWTEQQKTKLQCKKLLIIISLQADEHRPSETTASTHRSTPSILLTSLLMQIVPAMKILLSTLTAPLRRCCGKTPGLNYWEGSSLKVNLVEHKISLGTICSDVASKNCIVFLSFWWQFSLYADM